jgi:hypothetical protein
MNGPFPLTPALSPREREKLRPSGGESEIVGVFVSCAMPLPLPEGEGWGEGEQGIRVVKGADIAELFCHSGSLVLVNGLFMSLIQIGFSSRAPNGALYSKTGRRVTGL